MPTPPSRTTALPSVAFVGCVDEGVLRAVAERVLGAPSLERGVWEVETVYYHARVAVEVGGGCSHAEGVVAVADATDAASVAAAASALAAATTAEVKVLADVSGGEALTDDDALIDALADARAELVGVDVADAVRDAGLVNPDGEPWGTRRVREALEAHTWPGLVLRQPAGPPAPEQPEPPHGLTRGDHDLPDDDLAALFRSVAGVRAAGASLPDGRRRALAASAAIRLMDALGLDSESEEDNDEQQWYTNTTQAA